MKQPQRNRGGAGHRVEGWQTTVSVVHPAVPPPPVGVWWSAVGLAFVSVLLAWVLVQYSSPLKDVKYYESLFLAGVGTLGLVGAMVLLFLRSRVAAKITVAVCGLWAGAVCYIQCANWHLYIREFDLHRNRLLLLPLLVVVTLLMTWLALCNLKYRQVCHLDRLRRTITGRGTPPAPEEYGEAGGWDEGAGG